MELSTPFLHLKFNPLTMQFVSDSNKIDSSGKNLLTLNSKNYTCNEKEEPTSNIENVETRLTYQTSN